MFILLIILTTFVGITAQADIERAIEQENVETLATFFHPSIETFVLDAESTGVNGSKEIVRKFFASHSVKSFRKRHSGSSRGGSSNYAIGELSTDQGTYRVSIYYFTNNTGYNITELRIED